MQCIYQANPRLQFNSRLEVPKDKLGIKNQKLKVAEKFAFTLPEELTISWMLVC